MLAPRLGIGIVLSLVIVLAGPSGTALGGGEKPVTVQAGWGFVFPLFDGGFTPKDLSRRNPTPVRLFLLGRFAMTEPPPEVREIAVEVDQHFSIDVLGLPACGLRQLRMADTAAVEKRCGDAIVGHGAGEALLITPAGASIPVSSRLLVFNGGTSGRFTTFYVRGDSPEAGPQAFVVTVKAEKIARGHYGLLAVAKIPLPTEGELTITAFRLAIGRKFGYEGTRHGVFDATCTNGKEFAQIQATFSEGLATTGSPSQESLVRICTPSN